MSQKKKITNQYRSKRGFTRKKSTTLRQNPHPNHDRIVVHIVSSSPSLTFLVDSSLRVPAYYKLHRRQINCFFIFLYFLTKR